ncbi:ADP-ribose pyrophosphatase YjhB, NUDIX family [Apibacter mensalis]|uniref:ADP-ribose pyrophosphatase YjhB, NUDIX family n=1 Tax=Apibacter mensalis TaxID=1586267 RepID=A0A0X8XYP6_9FLAO|nr:NUDIX domain-containing protein [Apibacter mensalis]CVK15559.1 ADP-ribose pyrophosphatase YjhB, NUDIX family [Apibacter mensalis]
MYKISINERFLTIGKRKKKEAVNLPYKNLKTVLNALDILYHTKVKSIHIYSSDTKKIWEKLKKTATPVYASGGIVRNNKDNYLFIKRNGFWDLPKGHVEENETFKKAAKREVEEECSISNLHLKKYITTTYHVYQSEQKYFLKIVQWFEMEYKGKEKPQPQISEGIEKAKWVRKKEIPKLMKKTYINIKELISNYVLNE